MKIIKQSKLGGGDNSVNSMCICVQHMYFMFPKVTLERFERSNAIEIHNGIMFDFYPELPHMLYTYACITMYILYIHVCTYYSVIHMDMLYICFLRAGLIHAV